MSNTKGTAEVATAQAGDTKIVRSEWAGRSSKTRQAHLNRSIKRITNPTLTQIFEAFGYASNRWADESKYEDFQDYVAYLQKKLADIDERIKDIEVTDNCGSISASFRYADGRIAYSQDRFELKRYGKTIFLTPIK